MTGEGRFDGLDDVVVFDLGGVARVVERALVDNATVGAQDEELGREVGPVGLGDFLRLVEEVRKGEAFFLGPGLHVGQAVFLHLVDVDRHEGDFGFSA